VRPRLACRRALPRSWPRQSREPGVPKLKRRKLNLKAKFKGRSSYYSFKRLVPGGFNLGFIGSTCTVLPSELRVDLLFRSRQQKERPRRFDFLQAALEFPLHNQGLASGGVTGGGAASGGVTGGGHSFPHCLLLVYQGMSGQARKEDAESVNEYTGTL